MSDNKALLAKEGKLDVSQPLSLPRLSPKKIKTTVIFLVLCGMAFLFLLPFIWMLSTALKTPAEVTAKDTHIIPDKLMWSNFSDALHAAPFAGYVGNSLIVSILAVILTVFINCLAGYAFAKYKFRGRNLLFLMILSTLIIPVQITMIPNFYILKYLGWINSYAGLIVPRAAEAFGLFLARQYIMNIPDSLIEAARIDGASEFKIFRKVILPNIKPLIAVLVIFTFMWRWNELAWPLIAVSEQSMYTVQLGLAMLKGEHFINWTQLMSLTLLSVIPILIVFLIFQRYFIKGMVGSGMKE
ncbi:alpha-1,4-digalacturonate transport system permease protein [Fictibacillus enclensis]|uniref:Sugar ABC transporter permease n=1 Tax=Fictibacillus enclensis TaxID=1017270 RepID=A0A0V8J521_9BACL|nr:carbohydrate ABC transporter permease [Fictibacillus enclensis]KSU82049.1 sugar ABC transporter permease [Fictibacillus enclensis]SCC29555.1 alpha-1,4-digalacturonate transport system permease protein [Fictibacillus enclensis]